MSHKSYLYTILIFIASLLVLLVPVSAGVITGYGIEILSVDATCQQVFAEFRFENFTAPTGTVTVVMSLNNSESEFVGSVSNSFVLNYEKDPPYNLLLPATLTSGSYKVTLEVSADSVIDTTSFTVSCDGTAAETSNKPVEIPPCKLHDERLDETCGSAPIIVYSQAREDGCYVSVYSKYGRADGKVVLLLQATPAEIAAAQSQGDNAVIDSVEVVNLGGVTIYWLPTTNEFQINAGPNEEDKVYVLNFTGCPASNVYTTNSYQEAQ